LRLSRNDNQHRRLIRRLTLSAINQTEPAARRILMIRPIPIPYRFGVRSDVGAHGGVGSRGPHAHGRDPSSSRLITGKYNAKTDIILDAPLSASALQHSDVRHG
jgi:hypothetical protein